MEPLRPNRVRFFARAPSRCSSHPDSCIPEFARERSAAQSSARRSALLSRDRIRSLPPARRPYRTREPGWPLPEPLQFREESFHLLPGTDGHAHATADLIASVANQHTSIPQLVADRDRTLTGFKQHKIRLAGIIANAKLSKAHIDEFARG